MTETRGPATDAAFRRADDRDLDRLLDLQAAYYREDEYVHRPEEARRAWTALLHDGRFGEAWVVEAGGVVEGYLVVTFGYSLEFLGRDAFVDELYLGEPFRGRGLGRQALQVAEEVCRRAGIRALHLEVEHVNEAAAGLYRRTGFVSHTRHLMTKWLDAPSG
jgi:GNAT superfamily N-acetyltransferase